MPTAFSAEPARPPAAPAGPRLPSWRGLAWTLGSLVAITALKIAAFDYIGQATPFLLYFASIIAAAWFDGWRGGLGATVLSSLLGTYFFLPPFHSFTLADFATAVRLGIFMVEGVAITAITTRLRGERGRAEAANADARGALAKLEGVLHGVADGITVQSARGELIYANDAAAKLTGFPSAEALQAASLGDIMKRFQMLTPEGEPFPVSELPGRRVLQGLPTSERLIRFRAIAWGQGNAPPPPDPDDDRWALVRASAIRLPGSDLPYAVNVFQDVTESRKQDEALRVSREWLSTTLRSIGDAVIATDAGGRITFINPIAEALTGWDATAARDKPLGEVFRIFNEETRAPVESPVDRVLREGTAVGLANHTILISRDGTEIAVDDSAAPIRGTDGRIDGTVLIFRDVSPKRADERRRAFGAQAATEMASSLDYESTLGTMARLAVPTIADWCAVDICDGEELRRLAVAHVDPEKVRAVYDIQRRYPEDPRNPAGVHEVARTGKHLFLPQIPDELLVAAARDQEHLRLVRQLQLRSLIAVPLVANGTVLGVLSLAMAESGRSYGQADLELAVALADRAALAVNHARLYAEATRARQEAERANRAKDEFLAMLGHELRNPLAPILTALQLMKLRAPEALERERSVVERQVKHVVTLVDDLLDVARITRQKIKLAREPVDLADVLAKALELAEPLIEERRHAVSTVVPRGSFVLGDPVRLAQVLSNLLTNAAKYTHPGGRIEVTGAREGDDIVVVVRDNGIGIHPDVLPRIFDLFVQGSQSLDRAMGGLGLGLTIVRTVVELHGGRVSARSDGPGRGSELRVALPALSPEAVAAARPPATPAPTVGRAAGIHVLIVDDNVDALELLAEALDLLGFRAHTASDAAEALDVARTVLPAVALLDIGLPVMDGYELARRLRSTTGLAGLKLVAITGYGQESDKEQARAAGFDEHLVKPISVDDLEGVLARLVVDVQ